MSSIHDGYKPLSLMFVEYKSGMWMWTKKNCGIYHFWIINFVCLGDMLGFALAWFTMLPIFFAFSLGTLIVMRRDLTTVKINFVFCLFKWHYFFLLNRLK